MIFHAWARDESMSNGADTIGRQQASAVGCRLPCPTLPCLPRLMRTSGIRTMDDVTFTLWLLWNSQGRYPSADGPTSDMHHL